MNFEALLGVPATCRLADGRRTSFAGRWFDCDVPRWDSDYSVAWDSIQEVVEHFVAFCVTYELDLSMEQFQHVLKLKPPVRDGSIVTKTDR